MKNAGKLLQDLEAKKAAKDKRNEEMKKNSKEKYTEPFKGIKSAFRKFRTGLDINDEEELAIINLIDQLIQ